VSSISEERLLREIEERHNEKRDWSSTLNCNRCLASEGKRNHSAQVAEKKKNHLVSPLRLSVTGRFPGGAKKKWLLVRVLRGFAEKRPLGAKTPQKRKALCLMESWRPFFFKPETTNRTRKKKLKEVLRRGAKKSKIAQASVR